MRFRQYVSGAALFLTVGHAWAQIPTVDIAAIAKYSEQIIQMKQQLDQSWQLYNQLNGLRNVGSLMNDRLVQQTLPPDFVAAYNALRSGRTGSLSGISGSLSEIQKMYQSGDCSKYPTSSTRAACEEKWRDNAMNQYIGEAGYQQAARNIQELQTFVDAIRTSPDPKTLQDLQARISVEQIKLQNEQMKLNTVLQMQKARDEMNRTNAIENTVNMLKPGMIRF